MSKLILQTKDRQGYDVKQIEDRDCMTVGELRRILEDYDEDTPIIVQGITCPGGADFGPLVNTEDYTPKQCFISVFLQNNETGEKVYILDDISVPEDAEMGEVEEIVDDEIRNANIDDETQAMIDDDETWFIDWEYEEDK